MTNQQQQKQKVIVNIGTEILKGLKKKKRKGRHQNRKPNQPNNRQPFTYVPPQVPHQSVAPLAPVSNKQQDRETQRIWASLSDIQRNAVRTQKENERKFGKRTGLVNPKGLQIEDKKPIDRLKDGFDKHKSRKSRPVVLSDSDSGTKSVDSDLFRQEQVERRRKIVEARKVQQKIRNSNQVDNNLKEQNQDPAPSRNVPQIHPSIRQRVLSSIGLGGKQKVMPIPEKPLLTLRSPDYYDGKKSGSREARSEAQREIRGVSQRISTSNPSNRTQTALYQHLGDAHRRMGGGDLTPPRRSGRPLGGGGGGGAGNVEQRREKLDEDEDEEV